MRRLDSIRDSLASKSCSVSYSHCVLNRPLVPSVLLNEEGLTSPGICDEDQCMTRRPGLECREEEGKD